MDHEQIALEVDGHDLKATSLHILTEEDKPCVWYAVTSWGWRLLDADSVVGDDMPDVVLRYSVACRSARKAHVAI